MSISWQTLTSLAGRDRLRTWHGWGCCLRARHVEVRRCASFGTSTTGTSAKHVHRRDRLRTFDDNRGTDRSFLHQGLGVHRLVACDWAGLRGAQHGSRAGCRFARYTPEVERAVAQLG